MANWVSSTGYTFTESDQSVYDAAFERARKIFSLGLPVVVSFSGGKDSTGTMMVMLEVARELGKLPLEVATVDEEVIDPDTVAYLTEVSTWDEVNLRWLCVPIRHTLRGVHRPHWTTWDPGERADWARELPPGAVTLDDIPDYPDISKASYYQAITAYYRSIGIDKITQVAGIRMEESYNRRRAIIQAGRYIHKRPHGYYGKPIYDWNWHDLWKAILENGWPHSGYYDKMWTQGVSMVNSRVAPWGNVAGSREVRYYPAFYPDFWERAIRRLPELRASARYGFTPLYRTKLGKPKGLTWQEYFWLLLSQVDEESRTYWTDEIERALRTWSTVSTMPFPEEPFKIGTTLYEKSWKRYCGMIGKNDRFQGSSRDIMS